MQGLVATVGAAVAVFAGTNIDDIVILTVLFLTSAAHGVPRRWQIMAGQYTGIGALLLISVLAALGLSIVPDRWIGLLGLLPLGLGLRGLVRAVRARRDGQPASPAVATGWASVAAVTIANGADNISVYTPMFRTLGPAQTLITVTVFAILVPAWCAAGAWLGSHHRVIRIVQRAGHWLVPLVFIAIGTIIVAESGVIGELP